MEHDRKQWLPILRDMLARYEKGDVSHTGKHCPLCEKAYEISGMYAKCVVCPWYWLYEERTYACERWAENEFDGDSFINTIPGKEALTARIEMLRDWIKRIEGGDYAE